MQDLLSHNQATEKSEDIKLQQNSVFIKFQGPWVASGFIFAIEWVTLFDRGRHYTFMVFNASEKTTDCAKGSIFMLILQTSCT